jgi:Zinc carboxypeptidase
VQQCPCVEQEVTYPCADNWPGFQPFMEPEAVAMAKFISSNEIALYLAIHTYGQVQNEYF